ncbi:MAG: bifunctional diaminohydroxyphosphoribosylaminopyrimidine deaminase/5-amino-6-(5-phosphoribosylamino)uracil reductase RibD [Lachnospiraceae bacterium]|nr:bifunctional diaminohydroxyphosphoribosylaminopyrimidine deaminase/5-amino-6-(5-phosphoribosylamino)uracil reductase RibD [Lachnospiraceae bacterium]
MKRALELAKKGEGKTAPNPMVGCVVVKDGEIIGEGFHEEYGKLHAERNALNSLSKSAEGAELYVTLEPCCHYGKTPPCTEAIIEHKIKRVIIACVDENPLVGGQGIEILKKHGICVTVGVLKEEAMKLNEVFFHYISKKRPFIAMKYAMTLDGKIATVSRDSKWITSEESRNFVQVLRNRYKAILVGIHTVLEDDPMLNCRIEGGVNPVRIILDSKLRIPIESKIVKTAKEIETIVVTTKADEMKKETLKSLGVKIMEMQNEICLPELLTRLGERNIDSILVEGGGRVHGSFLQENLVDRVYAFIAPKLIGGEKALSPVEGKGIQKMADAVKLKDTECTVIAKDILITGRVEKCLQEL